ncbi:MAG: hypothetical protein FWD16_07875, partial [Clostridia bacterium]|nr:hypothetical protein [Clostridia bacterium]
MHTAKCAIPALTALAIVAAVLLICFFLPVAVAAVGIAGFLAFLLAPLHSRMVGRRGETTLKSPPAIKKHRNSRAALACLGIGMAPIVALLASIPFLYTYLDDLLKALGEIQKDADALAGRV